MFDISIGVRNEDWSSVYSMFTAKLWQPHNMGMEFERDLLHPYMAGSPSLKRLILQLSDIIVVPHLGHGRVSLPKNHLFRGVSDIETTC
jgi:hypothetical protein